MDFDQLLQENIIEINYGDTANDCEVDLSEELLHPETLISIGNHEYKGKYYDTPVMTAGEFSAITAVSKAKKSFLKSALIAAYIGGNSSNFFGNIKSHRDKDYTILDFDTEQSKYYSQRTFRRVQEMTGTIYNNYHCYVTRHLNSSDKLGLIDYCLKNQDELYKEKVKLISIDGIADLVENTNDIILSKEAADYLLRWTYEYNIHVITIIHKGSATGRPLGHLGTYVLKKAETVIELDVDDDSTIKVTNPYSRGYKFDEFNFDVNKDALPYLIEQTF